jgi:hypothetical protein
MWACIRVVAAVFLLSLFQACATTPELPLDGDEHEVSHDIDALLDRGIGPIEAPPGSKLERELTLLRGQLVVAMITRYGVARINDFSADRANDANKLLGQLDHTKEAMRKARAALQNEEPFYNVYRTDLRFMVLEMAGTAVQPTIRGVTQLVVDQSTLDRIRNGRRHLQNVLEDALYATAYREDFTSLLQQVKTTGKVTDTHWRSVNQQLRDACERLDRTAGRSTPTVCAPPEFDKAL